ncbi:MAG: hypothetical protein U1E17_04980 [Geminicoccaceae bacterium]
MCAGFPAGGIAHQLVSGPSRTWSIWRSATAPPATRATIPATTRKAELEPDGQWRFTHKDSPY